MHVYYLAAGMKNQTNKIRQATKFKVNFDKCWFSFKCKIKLTPLRVLARNCSNVPFKTKCDCTIVIAIEFISFKCNLLQFNFEYVTNHINVMN